ncbi:organelle RRM domain-containing protein 2, mitochondrial-like isoform X1 [Mangifera indica]|uniref:organelle RRM domain-containing protein 2, mitochondrial-like isoform X1 n=1 Tax=Mangifera indica TaxID=29780 RepID=UPI001CF99007|nr:organelle RRM domain-containing protein 2, mitochondrial-like isoform X1 [Mangifera indica]
MAMRAVAAHRGLRRLFSTSPFPSFNPPPSAAAASQQPKAEPSSNLFVSGLSKRTTTEGLKEAFSQFGEVVQARVVTDRVSGYSKGFGFVRYATLEDAAKGIEGMDGKFLDGWVIFAEYARPRAPPTPSSDNMSSQYGHNMSSPNGRQ